MSADQYLLNILNREQVDTGVFSPIRNVQATLLPLVQRWAGNQLLGVSPSGSFAKGTANASGTDIDLFISLSEGTSETLKQIYESLFTTMQLASYTPRRQNVSINVTVGGYDVDLVPAKRQNVYSSDHSLYRRKADTWTKTNVDTHINLVRTSGRTQEIRVLKLWRNQKSLDFPSFYLELAVISALAGKAGSLSQTVWTAFQYLRDSLGTARIVDPANSNNVISEDLTVTEKAAIKAAATTALAASDWNQIVV